MYIHTYIYIYIYIHIQRQGSNGSRRAQPQHSHSTASYTLYAMSPLPSRCSCYWPSVSFGGQFWGQFWGFRCCIREDLYNVRTHTNKGSIGDDDQRYVTHVACLIHSTSTRHDTSIHTPCWLGPSLMAVPVHRICGPFSLLSLSSSHPTLLTLLTQPHPLLPCPLAPLPPCLSSLPSPLSPLLISHGPSIHTPCWLTLPLMASPPAWVRCSSHG